MNSDDNINNGNCGDTQGSAADLRAARKAIGQEMLHAARVFSYHEQMAR